MEIIKREKTDTEFWGFLLRMTYKYSDSFDVSLDPSLYKFANHASSIFIFSFTFFLELIKSISKLYQINSDNKLIPIITR